MSNISEKVYLQKMESSPEPIKSYVSGIFLNNSYLNFVEKYRNSITNKKEVADTLRNETLLFLIKINSFDAFIENIVEILDIEPLDAEKIVEDFFNICIPGEVQNLIVELNSTQNKGVEKNKLEEAKLSEKIDSTHISHQDVLSEIENPTPSISTTTDFQNRVVETAVNTPTITSTTKPSIATSTTLTNSSANQTQSISLHSSDPSVVPYTNPALHIATKLDQNLGTPSASIPKDVYVSKKPDPYHEPVDL